MSQKQVLTRSASWGLVDSKAPSFFFKGAKLFFLILNHSLWAVEAQSRLLAQEEDGTQEQRGASWVAAKSLFPALPSSRPSLEVGECHSRPASVPDPSANTHTQMSD